MWSRPLQRACQHHDKRHARLVVAAVSPKHLEKKAAVRRGADSRIGQERMTLGRLVDYLADGIDSTFGGGVGFAFK